MRKHHPTSLIHTSGVIFGFCYQYHHKLHLTHSCVRVCKYPTLLTRGRHTPPWFFMIQTHRKCSNSSIIPWLILCVVPSVEPLNYLQRALKRTSGCGTSTNPKSCCASQYPTWPAILWTSWPMDTASSVVGSSHTALCTSVTGFLFGTVLLEVDLYCLVAWNDDKIRVFAPESGRLMFTIHDAHKEGVTAVCGTRTCKRLISGGGDGRVSIKPAVDWRECRRNTEVFIDQLLELTSPLCFNSIVLSMCLFL